MHARFVAPARQEFLSGAAWYAERETGLGARFTAAVEEAVKRALTFPDARSPAPHSTRRVLVRDFPHAVIHRPDQSGIVIFAVAHHARKPTYA